MATILEELRLRLGVDGSQVDPEMQKFEGRIKQGAKEGAKFYEHVGSEGHKFKRLLEQINETIPGLGDAFTFLVKPSVAAIGVITGAVVWLRSHIEKVNQELDKTLEFSHKAISNFNPREGARAASESAMTASESNREFWRKLNSSGDNPIVAAIKQESAERDRAYEKEKRQIEDIYRQRKQSLQDEVALKERMIQRLPEYLRETARAGLQSEATLAQRALDLAHTDAARIAADRQQEQTRAALLAGKKRLEREMLGAAAQEKFAEMDQAAARDSKKGERAGNIAGLEAAREQLLKDLEAAKKEAFREVQGSNWFYDVGGTAINYGKVGINALNRMLGFGRLQYPVDTGKLTGKPGESAQTDLKLSDLERQLRDLNRAIEAGKDANVDHAKAEKESTERVKDKQAALEKLKTAYEGIIGELKKLPQAVPGAQASPLIDPATGGYAYRPLENRGGIAYRPLRGALGYIDPNLPKGPPEPQMSPLERMSADMAMLLKLAQDAGIRIAISEAQANG